MKRWVDIAGQSATLEWSGGPPDFDLTFTPDGGPPVTLQVSVVEVEPGVYSVLAPGAAYEIKTVPAHHGWAVAVDGHHFVLSLADPREGAPRSSAEAAAGPLRLSVPMPGRVVRVLAAAGDDVQAGQGIVVVEAMKMQNEVKAPRAGRLTSLTAAPGDTVTPGQVLAVLE